MEKKVVELVILPEDEESGVSAISLVDRPAIEVNFMYFKKEEPVKMEADTSGLAPYVDPGDDLKPIEEVYSEYQLETMIELAKTLGVPGENVKNDKEKFNKVVDETFAEGDITYLYRYTSSNTASNSRTFCAAMMSIDRYFTRKEILTLDDMNNGFGPGVGGGRYNVFKYKGGSNCQHYWAKYRAVEINGSYLVTPVEPETSEEMIAATAPRTFNGRGFVKRPERSLPPLAGHSAFHFADEDKRIIVSPAMIPDKEIFRLDEEGNEYFVTFTPETILEISQKFMQQARTNETNVDHNESLDAGSYIFESWIVETETDKAITKYGFDVPIGTWMVMMKITDDAVWDMVKSGKVHGLSVEGAFIEAEELESQKKYERIRDLIQEAEPNDL